MRWVLRLQTLIGSLKTNTYKRVYLDIFWGQHFIGEDIADFSCRFYCQGTAKESNKTMIQSNEIGPWHAMTLPL